MWQLQPEVITEMTPIVCIRLTVPDVDLVMRAGGENAQLPVKCRVPMLWRLYTAEVLLACSL